MTHISVVDRSGIEHNLELQDGISLMEGLRDRGFDELLSLCGGCCSCATCHVYLYPADGVELSAPSEDESDLLDSSDHRIRQSRLSCQIIVGDALEGAKIIIAREG